MPCPPCYVPWCSPVKWVLLFLLLSHPTPRILPAAGDMCVLGLSSLVSWKNLESMDYLLQVYSLCVHAKLLQSSLTLFDPMDCSPPGSSVHGILQARTLEWVAISFSRESLSIVFLPSQVNSILTVACRGFNTLCFVLVSFHILFLLIIPVGSYSEGFPKM